MINSYDFHDNFQILLEMQIFLDHYTNRFWLQQRVIEYLHYSLNKKNSLSLSVCPSVADTFSKVLEVHLIKSIFNRNLIKILRLPKYIKVSKKDLLCSSQFSFHLKTTRVEQYENKILHIIIVILVGVVLIIVVLPIMWTYLSICQKIPGD